MKERKLKVVHLKKKMTRLIGGDGGCAVAIISKNQPEKKAMPCI